MKAVGKILLGAAALIAVFWLVDQFGLDEYILLVPAVLFLVAVCYAVGEALITAAKHWWSRL